MAFVNMRTPRIDKPSLHGCYKLLVLSGGLGLYERGAGAYDAAGALFLTYLDSIK